MDVYTGIGGTQAAQQASNPFFGTIIESFKEGIGIVGKEILPNWTAKQLGLQSQDQLYDTTYD